MKGSRDLFALLGPPREVRSRGKRSISVLVWWRFSRHFMEPSSSPAVCALSKFSPAPTSIMFCCHIILPRMPASSKWIIWGFLTKICVHFSSLATCPVHLLMQFCPFCCFLCLSSSFLFNAVFDIQPDSFPSAVGVSAFLLLCAGPPDLRPYDLASSSHCFVIWYLAYDVSAEW